MSDFVKQNVQWFPGHMAKTGRQIRENLRLVDAVAEILDARAPRASANPDIARMTAGKPRIVLLNKCDLADDIVTAAWVRHFAATGLTAIPVDCKTGRGLKQFKTALSRHVEGKTRSNLAKGMAGKAVRVMVLGIPNTGKSTFINKLAGRKKAQTADKPGVTRQNQWFPIGAGLEMLDTPGVLWPKFDDPAVGDKLSFIGAVKDSVTDTQTVASRLLALLAERCPGRLQARYALDTPLALDGAALLESVALKRGMRAAGGQPDTERAAAVFLDEFRGGKLGRISLETPEEA